MPLIKTSNPAFSGKTFENVPGSGYGGMIDATARMSLSGTVNKTGVLLVCAMATAAWVWHVFVQSHDMTDVAPYLTVGAIGGFIVAMVTVFKKEWAALTAPLYAALEGMVLGGLSALFDFRYPGVAFQAVGLTFGTLFVLLALYSTGMIKVTQKFRLGLFAATGGIMLFYLLEVVLGFFHVQFLAINSGSGIGIVFSLFVCGIAALNLVLDFDFIEQGVNFGAPKYMEWYGAFGIMVTLVWLYLEILRLLSKIRSRN
jgi:uncharacterized YccA/Bax inhibitor family protein